MKESKDNMSLLIKWLELVENNILRMSEMSSKIKNWALLIVIAVIALIPECVGTYKYIIIICLFIGTLVFCGLDMYYLCLEKAYRDKYKEITEYIKANEIPNDLLSLELQKGYLKKYIKCALKSPSIEPFYPCLVAMCIIAFVALIFIG